MFNSSVGQCVAGMVGMSNRTAGRQTHENIQTSYQQSASQRTFSWDAKILIQMGRKIPIVPQSQTVSCKGVTLTRPSVNT